MERRNIGKPEIPAEPISRLPYQKPKPAKKINPNVHMCTLTPLSGHLPNVIAEKIKSRLQIYCDIVFTYIYNRRYGMEIQIDVADCLGNNCAVICPKCQLAFCVSGFLNKESPRKCPHCKGSEISFPDAKAIWDAHEHKPEIDPEQSSNRLIFKKEWLGYDVWVTFSENGVTYRYPHDQLLQTFFSRLGIIENSQSWKINGLYHFPRLSEAQKKILERYILK